MKRLEKLSFCSPCAPPAFLLNKRRPKGVAAKGIAYQNSLFRFLRESDLGGELFCEQWWRYADGNHGKGWAQPDAYLVFPDVVVLFEAKLTGQPAARVQLERLYAPLLAMYFRRPVRCLQVCKWLPSDVPGPFFADAAAFISSGASYGCWNWLGR